MLSRKAILRVCPRTTRVCSRLLRGTERGAKRILQILSVESQAAIIEGRHTGSAPSVLQLFVH